MAYQPYLILKSSLYKKSSGIILPIGGGIGSSYFSQGYQCESEYNGVTGVWTCLLQGQHFSHYITKTIPKWVVNDTGKLY